MTPDWQCLFPDADHRFRMGLRAGDAVSFWRDADASGSIAAERRRWLAESPNQYVALLPEGHAIAREALEMVAAWAGVEAVGADADDEDLAAACLRAGGLLEPDWVLLSADTESEPRVVGGAVVFPSSWSLPEKLGSPLHEVHAPAPTLQATLGRSIGAFLNRLEPGAAWERDNWGLSADAEFNHHPTRSLPGLTISATLATTWLRLERQFLTRLPVTRGLLFGIRIGHHRLDELAAVPGLAPRLAVALETMQAEVAQYKGLQDARAALVAQLRNNSISADENGSVP